MKFGIKTIAIARNLICFLESPCPLNAAADPRWTGRRRGAKKPRRQRREYQVAATALAEAEDGGGSKSGRRTDGGETG